MALITDPDNLNQATEVVIDASGKTIKLTKTGNLSDDGVTLQCLYSFLEEEQKADTTLIKFPFPMTPITNEQFELKDGWNFLDATTKQLIRTGGWAVLAVDGTTKEEWAGIVTLGSIGASDQVYYQQSGAGSATNIVLTGAVNQAVQIYGDATSGNFNYRTFFKIFVREYQKAYAQSQLSDIGVTTMTYQVYRFPLANAADLKITHNDTTVSTMTPYSGMSITWYGTPQDRTIGGVARQFNVIIDGNNGLAEEIYEFVQQSLRQATDIDDGAGEEIGKVTDSLLVFVGDTLKTRLMSDGGVYIDNFLPADTNRLVFVDNDGTERTYPYVATLILQFGENLSTDDDAVYKVFFTNDDAGENTGRDFGTNTAIVVNDADGTAMSGLIDNNSSIQLSYDYDGNEQRGVASKGIDAPITVVAIGLNKGQYVKATGTIAKSTSNTVSLVAALERNYSNPA